MNMRRSARRPLCMERPRPRTWPAEPAPATLMRPRGRRARIDACPRAEPARADRALTPDQVAAITSIMRLFVDDDLAGGVSPGCMLRCAVCLRARPAPGFIQYDAGVACNACAIQYEISRARGLVRTLGEFVTDRDARHSA